MLDLLDAHMHTIASGHAYSTLSEMILSGRQKGLKLVGITEHTNKMPGTCHEMYFYNFKVIPRIQDGIEVRMGAEVNIMDYSGAMDLSERAFSKIDYAIASLHDQCLEPGSQEENTRAVINAMQHPKIKIIGHPDNGYYPVDYDRLAAAAKERGVLLELNNSSLHPKSGRINSRENILLMLKACLKHKTNLIIDSDAHICCDVGNHKFVHEILNELSFPEELIVNTSVDKFKKFVD